MWPFFSPLRATFRRPMPPQLGWIVRFSLRRNATTWSLLSSEGLSTRILFLIYFVPVVVLIVRPAHQMFPGPSRPALRLAVENGILILSCLRSCSTRVGVLQGTGPRNLLRSVPFRLRGLASTPPETDHLPRNSVLISLAKTTKLSSTTKSLQKFNAFLHPKMLRLRNRRPITSKCETRICSSTHSRICKVARQDGGRQCTSQITRPTLVK